MFIEIQVWYETFLLKIQRRKSFRRMPVFLHVVIWRWYWQWSCDYYHIYNFFRSFGIKHFFKVRYIMNKIYNKDWCSKIDASCVVTATSHQPQPDSRRHSELTTNIYNDHQKKQSRALPRGRVHTFFMLFYCHKSKIDNWKHNSSAQFWQCTNFRFRRNGLHFTKSIPWDLYHIQN